MFKKPLRSGHAQRVVGVALIMAPAGGDFITAVREPQSKRGPGKSAPALAPDRLTRCEADLRRREQGGYGAVLVLTVVVVVVLVLVAVVVVTVAVELLLV